MIGQANGTLIALIDRIRMLDNDLIRLNQKVEVVLQLRGKTIDKERIIAEQEINIDPFKKKREEDAAKAIGPKGRKATPEEVKNAAGDE